jgi:hypothetical protein
MHWQVLHYNTQTNGIKSGEINFTINCNKSQIKAMGIYIQYLRLTSPLNE